MNPPLEDFATWQEINAQPSIWQSWMRDFMPQLNEIRAWIKARGAQEIIFSGAGTSAYIGETVVRAVKHSFLPVMRTVPTTDIVGDPSSVLAGDHHKLVVQFGRSGNSSETVGSLDILDAHLPNADRLNITCNAESALATRPPQSGEQRVIVLPPETHDTGFAMTSSFTTMLLTALAVFSEDTAWIDEIDKLAREAESIIADIPAHIGSRPERAVFLGTGALEPIARECALKVLELTAGKTMTSWDSTLGFRHGPKAAINKKTTVFVMVRPDKHSSRYDIDIALEIKKQFPDIKVITCGPYQDINISVNSFNGMDTILQVLVGQVAGVIWSAQLGLNVDDPFQDHGRLTRVVTGVTLYPLPTNKTL